VRLGLFNMTSQLQGTLVRIWWHGYYKNLFCRNFLPWIKSSTQSRKIKKKTKNKKKKKPYWHNQYWFQFLFKSLNCSDFFPFLLLPEKYIDKKNQRPQFKCKIFYIYYSELFPHNFYPFIGDFSSWFKKIKRGIKLPLTQRN
jgi:hypothetical protein